MFQAKFKVQSVQDFGNDTVQVVMNPVMGENPFTKYTPSGNITFACCNPEVNKQLAPGKTFLINFEEVDS